MKEKINKILLDFALGKLTHDEATQQVLDLFAVIGSFSMQDLMLYYQDAENFDFTSKAIEVLNSMVNDR